jgi:hypothetical protein
MKSQHCLSERIKGTKMGMYEGVGQGVSACFISTSLESKPNPIPKKTTITKPESGKEKKN